VQNGAATRPPLKGGLHRPSHEGRRDRGELRKGERSEFILTLRVAPLLVVLCNAARTASSARGHRPALFT